MKKGFRFLIAIVIVGGIAIIALQLFSLLNGGNSDSDSISDSSLADTTPPSSQYKVDFDLNPYGKGAPSAQYVYSGECAIEPIAPMRRGYDFAGWYLASDGSGDIWNFAEDVIATPTTLYAKWTLQEYEISFDLSGGSGASIESQTRNYLSCDETDETDIFALTNKVAEPSGVYTKSEFEFAGWWVGDSVDNYSQEWNFASDLPNESMTLYAGWGNTQNNGIFSYIELANCVKITGFVGAIMPETLVIPAAFDGKPVLSIGARAFEYASEMYAIDLPSTLTTIGERAFFSCISLGEIDIPDTVTSIGEMAFSSCSGLYDIALGDGLSNIGEKAFYQCTDLFNSETTSLFIPENIIAIETDAFSIVAIDGTLYDIQFNDGLVYIGYHAFAYAYILDLFIPDSVEVIAREAFAYCHYLTRIDCGRAIRFIGYQAFSSCNYDLYITVVQAKPISIKQGTFGAFPLDAHTGEPTRDLWIMVPDAEAEALYEQKEYWSQYAKNIIAFSIVGLITYPTRP